MTRSLVRSIGSITAGLIAAMALIIAVEAIAAIFHPFPPGVDTTDQEVVKAHVAKFPHWVLALAVVGWGITTFASVWIATRMGAGRHPAHGIAIGSLLFLAAAFNMFLLPYPVWFVLANLLIIPLAVFRAVKVGRAPQSNQSVVETEPGN
jgi:hypothetical protein